MSALGQKLRGNLYLAYRALIAHPLRRLFRDEPGTGQQRFLANYGPEGNIPYTEEDRAILRGASRCIHCGLCNAYDRALLETSRQLYAGASLIPLSYARATPDLPRARATLAALRDDGLLRSEAVCPTRVPLRAIAALLRRKLQELDAIAVEAAAFRAPPPKDPPGATAGSLPAPELPGSRLADKAPDRATVRAALPDAAAPFIARGEPA